MIDKIFRAMRFGLRRSREVQHSLNRIPQDIRHPLLESWQESFVSDLERVRLSNARVFGNRPLGDFRFFPHHLYSINVRLEKCIDHLRIILREARFTPMEAWT